MAVSYSPSGTPPEARPDGGSARQYERPYSDAGVRHAPPMTGPLRHNPSRVPCHSQGNRTFGPGKVLLLQALPSGACVWLTLDTPLELGRAVDAFTGNLVDLTDYNAEWHGVSRRHCRLARHGHRLIVTDLDSTNGTYVNGRRLAPSQPTVLADGDHLILGTLHLAVFFVPSRTSQHHACS